MNRITRERIKKQREAKGFTGIQIKDLGKFFKRKEMQAPTPSGVTQKKTTTTKPTTKPQGRAEKMNANAAGNKQSNTKSTTNKTQTKGGRAQQMNANAAGNKPSTSKATDAEVKAWKARKPNSMKPESYKGFPNVGAALNAWRKEDPRKK
tara:strand:+ start:171 stop:620 length:450 start_codon:yes stop_codon:yes gene_type:complete